MIAFIKALLGLGGESVGPHEAVRRLNDGAVLIDVREPAEFSRARANAARSLPLGRSRCAVRRHWMESRLRRTAARSC